MRDIVFITVDSLRADHVGWHGYERDTTPFLDTLADEGHAFKQSFANGAWTRASFPAIMTSVYSGMYGGNERLSSRQTPVAEAAQAAGYETGGFHSNPHLLPKFGYERGFDAFYDSNSESSRVAVLRQWVKDNLNQSSILYRSLERAFAASEETVGFNPGTPFVPATELTDRAIQWIESTTDSPRCLWIHYMDVHHPYSPPEQYQTMFRDNPISNRRAIKLRRKMLQEPENITEAELATLIDLYDGEIRYVDDEVRRLIQSVRNQWDHDLTIVFTSDHGDEFLDHGGFSHRGTLYDELLHVPLLLHDGDESGTYDDIVELVDLPPTLLTIADANIPTTYEGEPLQLITAGGRKRKDYALCDAGDTLAYRDDHWKCIVRPKQVELYDIQSDSGETTNLSKRYPEVVADITEVFDEHREKVTQTDENLEAVEIDGEVQDRLEQLGYLQE